MDIQQPLSLLGGLTPAQFMRRHWQKKPLLVRQAIPQFAPPVLRSELFALAAQEGVESRLVQLVKGAWKLRHGPFNRRKLVFFMDDINMPAPDKYGTQESIALLQQHRLRQMDHMRPGQKIAQALPVRVQQGDQEGHDALICPSSRGHLPLIRLLVERGANLMESQSNSSLNSP